MLKKSILAALLIGGLSMGANAQGFYVKAGLGFATKTSSINTDGYNESWDYTPSPDKLLSEKVVAGSYGKGFGFNITPGYSFNEYLSAELDFSFLAGSKFVTTDYKGIATNYTYTEKEERNVKAGMFLSPSLVVSAGGEGKVKPYARFGAILPLGGKIIAKYNELELDGSDKDETMVTTETKTAFNLGFVGAAGVNFSLSEKMSLYLELVSSNLSAPGKKTTMTEYERKVNGNVVGKLSDLKTYQKEINYVKELNSSSNIGFGGSTLNQDKPYDRLREYTQLSSLGFRFGVKMAFGSK